jgi:hypothetical protein
VITNVLEEHVTSIFTSALNMEAIHCFRTFITTYKSIRHNPEEYIEHFYSYENFKPHKDRFVLVFLFITMSNTTDLENVKVVLCGFFDAGSASVSSPAHVPGKGCPKLEKLQLPIGSRTVNGVTYFNTTVS